MPVIIREVFVVCQWLFADKVGANCDRVIVTIPQSFGNDVHLHSLTTCPRFLADKVILVKDERLRFIKHFHLDDRHEQ